MAREAAARPPEETLALWKREQALLKARVVDRDTEAWQRDPAFSGLHRVGGVDVSYVKGDSARACASLVVLSYPELEVVYEDCRMVCLTAPYLPGFLAFREAPFLVDAVQRLREREPGLLPQVLLVDGNGVLHPRGDPAAQRPWGGLWEGGTSQGACAPAQLGDPHPGPWNLGPEEHLRGGGGRVGAVLPSDSSLGAGAEGWAAWDSSATLPWEPVGPELELGHTPPWPPEWDWWASPEPGPWRCVPGRLAGAPACWGTGCRTETQRSDGPTGEREMEGSRSEDRDKGKYCEHTEWAAPELWAAGGGGGGPLHPARHLWCWGGATSTVRWGSESWLLGPPPVTQLVSLGKAQ
ncbi:endonuclease V isoform X1 [Phyllostomus discolor]|uniref:Endonuclease V isoform X1 n=1 Tax=Phyllostomus discolor TaxID=89673 RepID=A0A6J2M9C1_9CHIR|nr:endonuclease V isoform X1 [Phyllostomus discolor]